MPRRLTLAKRNLELARKLWGSLPVTSVQRLEELTTMHSLSISSGDLIMLDGNWFVTHSGLLRISVRRHCAGIHVRPIRDLWDPDELPLGVRSHSLQISNLQGLCRLRRCRSVQCLSPLVRGAEMRVAETRAVNRALRKAYGIGTLLGRGDSVPSPRRGRRSHRRAEEASRLSLQMANVARDEMATAARASATASASSSASTSSIPTLVKSYATDFCGAKTLKEATRAQVENFVEHLADWAEKDRNALLCQLNSYPRAESKGEDKEGAA